VVPDGATITLSVALEGPGFEAGRIYTRMAEFWAIPRPIGAGMHGAARKMSDLLSALGGNSGASVCCYVGSLAPVVLQVGNQQSQGSP
jgi:hypothetical protein